MKKDIAVQKGGKAIGKISGTRAELAKYASEDEAREPVGTGNMISIRGGEFKLAGDVIASPMSVVILDYVFQNAYYTGAFDPESPQPPACFAVARLEGDMAPHESSPVPQHETCKGCSQNEFGSADRGRGKACKNGRKLALLNADVKDFNVAYIEQAEPAFLNIPPTSLKHISGYVKKMTQGMKLPLFSVITQLDFDGDEEWPVIVPQFTDEISDKKIINALVKKRDEVQSELLVGFDTSTYDPRAGLAKKSKKEKSKEERRPGKKKF